MEFLAHVIWLVLAGTGALLVATQGVEAVA